ncbi:MAG: hypothetical protein PW734_12645 [Verrucomicrobium sp.]|nr:hypothetical protein [Verrucomicrobium sp.]
MALPPLKVGIDADDTLWPHFGEVIARIGTLCDPPAVLGEKDCTGFYDWPALRGLKLQAGLRMRDGRTTQGGESITRNFKEKGPGMLTVYDFLEPDLYADRKPYPEAPAAVAAIAAMPGVEAYCVTAHPMSVLKTPDDPDRLRLETHKLRLNKEFFPGLKGTVFTRDKARQGLDVLIDDGGDHNLRPFLEAAAREGRPALALHMNRPWNVGEEIPGARRIYDMAEAVPLIARFREEHFAAARRSVPVPEIDIPAKPKTPERIG